MPGARGELRYRDRVTVDALFELGVPISDGDDEPLPYAECIRIARRLRTPGYAPVGLVPAAEDVPVTPLAIQLASALIDLTDQDTAYVDGLARIPTRSWTSADADDGARVSLRWLRARLAIATPAPAMGPCGKAAAGRDAIAAAARRFRHVVVDFTGFASIGELASALGEVNRIVIVASAVATTEAAVLATSAAMPRSKQLGVMLVG